MNRLIFFVFLLTAFAGTSFSQSETEKMQQAARDFMRKGDYENSILILGQAIRIEPDNINLHKDLSLSYYFQNDMATAMKTIEPVLEMQNTDDQCFQIAANIQRASGKMKEVEKICRRGLKRFPYSGPLYNDLGEILWIQKNNSAIQEWEKGIEKDPSYSRNYFNAAMYYFTNSDSWWGLIYAEIFLNMEPSSTYGPDIKKRMLNGYKKFFLSLQKDSTLQAKSAFDKAYVGSMNKQMEVLRTGIHTESLIMLRSRFLIAWWSEEYEKKFPFQLFEWQRILLQEGHFDSYNQWLFGPADDLVKFQQFTEKRNAEYQAYLKFRENRVFRMPAGQYYRN